MLFEVWKRSLHPDLVEAAFPLCVFVRSQTEQNEYDFNLGYAPALDYMKTNCVSSLLLTQTVSLHLEVSPHMPEIPTPCFFKAHQGRQLTWKHRIRHFHDTFTTWFHPDESDEHLNTGSKSHKSYMSYMSWATVLGSRHTCYPRACLGSNLDDWTIGPTQRHISRTFSFGGSFSISYW